MDPNQIRLARTLTDERLREAEAARQRRATWVATGNRVHVWLRSLTGRWRRAASRPADQSVAPDGHPALVERYEPEPCMRGTMDTGA